MSAVTVQQAFELALQHHRAGRLAEAEALYRQVLAVEPRHADALHLLGVIAHQAGRSDVAVEMILQSIALVPTVPAYHGNLGEAYRKLGRLDEAVAAFRRAVQLQPDYAEAHSNLGVALVEQGQITEGIAAYRRAIELQPDCLEAHYNLGNALRDQGQFEEAITAYRRAIQLQPDYAGAHCNLGIALMDQGRPKEAIAAYRQVIQLRPDFMEAHSNLGIALMDQGHSEEAIAAYCRAIQLQPDYAEAHSNLGAALMDQGHLEEAIAACRRAIQLQPDYAEAHCNLGIALAQQGHLAEAIVAYRRAIQLRPDFVEAHSNLGAALVEQGYLDEALAAFRRAIQFQADYPEAKFNSAIMLLLRGDFEHGWPLFEERRNLKNVKLRQEFAQPMWRGEPLHGRRVLIHAEQGLGDSIQFIRYAPLIAERGGQLVVECQRPLVELFRTVKGVTQIIAFGDPLPRFDVHAPMLSLPLAFETTFKSIPRGVPYVTADPVRCKTWRQRLGSERSRPRVGLAWAGSPKHRRDRLRSVRLEQLLPLLNVKGVDFFSLQKERGSEELQGVPGAATIIDPTGHLESFADTAALMMELDLIISVDTAVAHLAAALGRPVWTLLPYVPDWRWGLEGETTPWYPTMRLFRQPSLGDWDSLVRPVADELERLAAAKTL